MLFIMQLTVITSINIYTRADISLIILLQDNGPGIALVKSQDI